MSGTVHADGELQAMTTLDARPYHHGDLPNALRHAAADVIVERGLGNFSLREVARRAGVSHTAPAHHFGDMEGLLTSLATEGFETLTQAMEHALAGLHDPVERLAVMGETYVEFAQTHPAHCDVMFRQDIVDKDDVALSSAGLCSYAILEDTVRELIESEDLDVETQVVTSLCWAMVQGLVVLGPKLDASCEAHGQAPLDRPTLVRQFTDLLVNGLRSHRR